MTAAYPHLLLWRDPVTGSRQGRETTAQNEATLRLAFPDGGIVQNGLLGRKKGEILGFGKATPFPFREISLCCALASPQGSPI
eukprot:scaffold36991_cov79-Cyclotella_meneghiniana.AAC.2